MLWLTVLCARRALQAAPVCQEGEMQSDLGCPCAPCCSRLHPLETPPHLHMPQPFTGAPAAFHPRRLRNTGC